MQESTEFEIMRDGVVDKTYKPKKIKKTIKVAIKAFTGYFTSRAHKLANYIAKSLVATYKDIQRNIQLEAMDYKYNTSLRAQYHAGKRTQAILSTKRQYGLN